MSSSYTGDNMVNSQVTEEGNDGIDFEGKDTNNNGLPPTTPIPTPPSMSSRSIFSSMAPLHRPEFDSLVNIVKTLREDFRRESEMVKPDIAILKERVRESVLQYENAKQELEKYMQIEKNNVENTHSRLNNSVGFILEEIENIKEDIDMQDNNSHDLLKWRSAANTELVNIASKVDRIELHVGLHRKMLSTLRDDYGEDHGRMLRMERILKSIELNSDKLSDMMKQCVLKMNQMDNKLNTSVVEIKAYTDTQLNTVNTRLRKSIDQKILSNYNLNQKCIGMLVKKINTLEGFKNENQEAIKNIVEAISIFQENLASFISEFTISKRRQSEAMGKLDKTISDVSALKRTANAQHSKLLAMKEGFIRTAHASNDASRTSIIK